MFRTADGSAIRIVPLVDDADLLGATRDCIAEPLDLVVVTTAVGYPGLDRGCGHLGVGRIPAGRAGCLERCCPAGRRCTRWEPPVDAQPLRRLIAAVVDRDLQAMAFTSAPASLNFLRTADIDGHGVAVREALRSDVVAACVGSVAAGPLERENIPVVQPERFRLGVLVREIVLQVLRLAGRTIRLGEIELGIRDHGVIVEDSFVPLPPVGMSLLQALSARPGQVLSRSELLDVLPGEGRDGHAVEMAVARLRTFLGRPDLIQTVVKRGYRLSVPAPC